MLFLTVSPVDEHSGLDSFRIVGTITVSTLTAIFNEEGGEPGEMATRLMKAIVRCSGCGWAMDVSHMRRRKHFAGKDAAGHARHIRNRHLFS
ncbi:hypothetical protein GGQ73_000472 [Rhizobium skierniewicense]|uniref:Transposase n=1 Tax=Rhizobium skierniewicense TaxID=984260 RepID=A0A7W6C819_9HYPH|nr:hypothetical protein [Rhizobium skierniewicense]